MYNVYQGAKYYINQAKDVAGNKLNNAYKGVSNFAGNTYEGVSNFAGNVYQGVSNFAGNVYQGASNFAGNSLNYAYQGVRNLYGIYDIDFNKTNPNEYLDNELPQIKKNLSNNKKYFDYNFNGISSIVDEEKIEILGFKWDEKQKEEQKKKCKKKKLNMNKNLIII